MHANKFITANKFIMIIEKKQKAPRDEQLAMLFVYEGFGFAKY